MNPKVDAYYRNAKKWRAELEKLRAIVLDCELVEEFKWDIPCYMFEGANILLISAFKDYCALNFFKGALLKDPEGILVKPGENTQAGRQIRFTTVDEIAGLESNLKGYIRDAIRVEKAGLEVERNTTLTIPDELQKKMDKDSVFKAAFGALTPGLQRAYAIYFSGAKQSSTRESRIESCRERILNGKGLNDCVCGRTKKPPSCDGSHKSIR